MERRRSSFLVLAPLLVLGSLAGHAVAYLGAEPNAARRGALLARTGHAYLSWTPAVLGTAALVLVVGVALQALGAARGIGARSSHPLVVAVPVAGFAVQELVERALSGAASLALLHQRPFLLGLLVQALFGLLALAAGRFLVDGAERLGRLVVRRRAPAAAPAPRLPAFRASADLIRPRPLCVPLAGRAPPRPAS